MEALGSRLCDFGFVGAKEDKSLSFDDFVEHPGTSHALTDGDALKGPSVRRLSMWEKLVPRRMSATLEEELESHPVMRDPRVDFIVKNFLREAYLGSAESQYSIGCCYDGGFGGVEQNWEEAGQWYSLAASQGHPMAANNLGVLYINGFHGTVAPNESEALYWFKVSASKGYSIGIHHLAMAYLNGEGMMTPDPEHAFALFKKAAKKGCVRAQANVGAMYMCGRGTMQNPKKAEKWLRKAVASQDPVSCFNLSILIEDRDPLESRKLRTIAMSSEVVSSQYGKDSRSLRTPIFYR